MAISSYAPGSPEHAKVVTLLSVIFMTYARYLDQSSLMKLPIRYFVLPHPYLIIIYLFINYFYFLCYIYNKFTNEDRAWWLPCWAFKSLVYQFETFNPLFYEKPRNANKNSTPRSPFNIFYVFTPFMLISRLLYLQQFPNNNEDVLLRKILLCSFVRWDSPMATNIFLFFIQFYNLSHKVDIYINQGRPWWWPSWSIYSSPAYEIRLEIHQLEFRVEIRHRSSVSNMVAIGYGVGEEDHISNQGLNETFYSCSPLLAIGNDEEDHISSEVRSSASSMLAIANDEEDQISNEGLNGTSDSPRPFTLAELAVATNYFHKDRILGEGGFGAVYKAVFPNGQTYAVKRISSASKQGIKEYKAEVTIVSRSKHRYLVQLIGWCHEIKGEFMLVYELLENKSLDMHLFDLKMVPLPWDVRYKIAQGSAKALRYLHDESGKQCVLHRDVKSSNLLLDSNFEPKLSDFGLAMLVDYGKSMELSVIAGTKGYLAPECLTGKFGTHSDVYSYGVVALELATGRKSFVHNVAEDKQVLVKWVQNLYKASKLMEAVDPRLGGVYNKLQVEGLLILGLWCVVNDFRERPSMREIVHALSNTQDPLSDLHETMPTLVPDQVPLDFDSIHEPSSDIARANANGTGKRRARIRFGCFS